MKFSMLVNVKGFMAVGASERGSKTRACYPFRRRDEQTTQDAVNVNQ